MRPRAYKSLTRRRLCLRHIFHFHPTEARIVPFRRVNCTLLHILKFNLIRLFAKFIPFTNCCFIETFNYYFSFKEKSSSDIEIIVNIPQIIHFSFLNTSCQQHKVNIKYFWEIFIFFFYITFLSLFISEI